jgi:hypothetical protein
MILSYSAAEDVQKAVEEARICEVPLSFEARHGLPAVGGDLVAQHRVYFLPVFGYSPNQENVRIPDAYHGCSFHHQVKFSAKQTSRFPNRECPFCFVDLELLKVEGFFCCEKAE